MTQNAGKHDMDAHRNQAGSTAIYAGATTLVIMPLAVASLVTLDIIRIDFRGFWQIFLEALLYGVLTIGTVYVLIAIRYVLKDKGNTVRLTDMAEVVSDSVPAPQDKQIINLFYNDGTMKFSVRLKNIFFIESDDNYIKVWYTDSYGAMRQYMLRCRLKTIEDSFAGSDLVRCHRKYIVNISKVEILSKEKDGYVMDLGIEQAKAIPVSRTYEQTVLSRFNSR